MVIFIHLLVYVSIVLCAPHILRVILAFASITRILKYLVMMILPVLCVCVFYTLDVSGGHRRTRIKSVTGHVRRPGKLYWFLSLVDVKNSSNPISDKGLGSRIHTELSTFISTKNNQKMGKGHEQIFHGRCTDGKQAHEKMFNIISHQENANKSHNEVSLHTSIRMTKIKSSNSKYQRGQRNLIGHTSLVGT